MRLGLSFIGLVAMYTETAAAVSQAEVSGTQKLL